MARDSFYDQILDDILPEDFDWRSLVVDYPLAAVTLSLAGGVWLGRAHGSSVLSGLTSFAFREVSRNVQSFVGDFTGARRSAAYDEAGYEADDYTDDFGADDFGDEYANDLDDDSLRG